MAAAPLQGAGQPRFLASELLRTVCGALGSTALPSSGSALRRVAARVDGVGRARGELQCVRVRTHVSTIPITRRI